MDINHRHLSKAFLDMQCAIEALEPFFDEDSDYTEDEEEEEWMEESWEEEGEETYYQEAVPYSGDRGGNRPSRGGRNNCRRGFVNSSGGQRGGNCYPPTDMFETPDAYELEVELPGYDKKNIKIDMPNNRTLSVKGTGDANDKKKPQQSAAADRKRRGGAPGYAQRREGQQYQRGCQQQQSRGNTPKWLLDERTSEGKFSRNYNFPIPVNGSQIKASHENGVLKVIVPKYSKNVVTQIEIE